MDKELNNIVGTKQCTTYTELQEKYPQIFQHCMFDLIDGHGWIPTLDKTCHLIQRTHDQNQHMGCTQFTATQVKQKFGALRFYYSSHVQNHPNENTKWFDWSNWVHGVVDMTEEFCRSICEECGESGKIRNTNGYCYTACEGHVRK